MYRPRTKIRRPHPTHLALTVPTAAKSPPVDDDSDSSEDELAAALTSQTPRTKHLLQIINTKDVSQIKLLKGVGAKKAELIVNSICDLEEDARIESLGQLGKLKGVGIRTVENMRTGLGGLVL